MYKLLDEYVATPTQQLDLSWECGVHMEKTRVVLMIGRSIPGYWKPLTSKASNRAAVHEPPVPHILLLKEEVEKEIQKAKQEKEAKRKQIEDTIESHINNSTKSESCSAH
ncbi:hypothetical protein AAZX31_19G246800 [Glycine max]|uniref:Uncharacterized protein n=1 Tax=Glycine soja TaxID=3848 RepID=A0A445FLU1_GLYSO|nr:hypothetical protein GLYMA_19G261950v4 [Glycine max]KAH1079672.1 hypothetical protein GYH30_054287 [Glycine max]RZB49832.1 hypothetical protein D0Y65_052644 [Glycine soja]